MSRSSPVKLSYSPVFALVLLLATGIVSGQQDAVGLSNESLQRLSDFQRQLEAMETRFGPFDERLLAVLLSIEGELAAQGRDEEVIASQGRRLQILRMAVGLESLTLLPVLEDSLDTRMRLGDWDEAADLLAHMRYLQTLNFGENSEAVFAAMEREATLHLARVAVGDRQSRADNFMDARDLYEDMLDIAEERFGEQDPRLIPSLYRRAFTLYVLVKLLNTESGMAGETIDELMERDGSARLTTFRRPGVFDPNSVFGPGPGSRIPVVEGDEPVGLAYLRQALGYVDDIRDIAEAIDDQEMLAMATLYHGDFQLLMGRGSGRGDYRDALELLRAAGIAEERLTDLFAKPMVIPVETFFTRFDGLENYQQQLMAAAGPEADGDSGLGVFLAWHDDLRAVRMPSGIASLMGANESTSEVLLEFTVNSRGQVTSVDTLSAQPDEARVRRQAVRALREVRFRPRFIDGSPSSLRDATMIYRSPLEE